MIYRLKYFVVVLAGFLADYTLYLFLVSLGLIFYLANALAFVVGATITVILIRRFVFTQNTFQLP